ncbi:hypothetical protein V6L77_09410 [Pannonibacter sp. Pt2-lr]
MVHLIAVQIDDLSDLLLGLVRIGGEISSGVGIASSCGVCDLLVGRAVGRDPRDEGSFFRAEISGDFALCCFGFLVGVGFWGVFVSVLFFCDYMSDFKRFYPRFWRGFFVFLD